jgi:hypothetical protein
MALRPEDEDYPGGHWPSVRASLKGNYLSSYQLSGDEALGAFSWYMRITSWNFQV